MQKSILITGCSSGIGYDAAKSLKARGWRVFASCRKADDCKKLQAQGFESPQLDLADPASIEAGLNSVLEATGGTLDALFNNAAYAVPGYVEDLPRDALRESFEVNFFGTHDLTQRVIPVMRQQGHGRIVNCSSVLGFVTFPLRGAYSASKFALEGLSDTLRMEMADQGIDVILIQPGPITTKIRQNSIPHFERWIDVENAARRTDYERLKHRLYEDRGPDPFELSPSEVSKVLVKALESPKPRAHYRVTTPTKVINLLRRVLPTSIMDRILSKV
ncbi:MAG: SDR family NAD(P)-dependent oxidoreductase [Pseudomonadota bacterium]